MQAGCLQIVEALRGVRVVQGFDGIWFDEDGALDHEIDGVLAADYAVVGDGDPVLLCDGQAGLALLARERVLVDLFEESGAERVQDLECGADDAPDRRFVSALSACIGVHLRLKLLAVVRARQVLRSGGHFCWSLVNIRRRNSDSWPSFCGLSP